MGDRTKLTGFTCKVKREDGEWGVAVDGWSNCIQLIDIKDGKIQEYNECVSEQQQLKAGDFIVQIDGEDVTKKSLEAFKNSTEADVKIARPEVLNVRIEKGMRGEGMGWGLKLNFQKARSTYLRIGKIDEGGVAEFNKDVENPVQEKDFIVEVNGCRGNVDQMLEIFRASFELELTLMRLP